MNPAENLRRYIYNATEQECVWAEEREPSGRLILGPCLHCGASAMDAIDQLQNERMSLLRENERLRSSAFGAYVRAVNTTDWQAIAEAAERRVEELGFALTDLVNAIQKRGGMKGTTPALDRAQAALSSDKDA